MDEDKEWISKIQSNYQHAMAHDPFGPPGSLRFWLHDQFLVLVTLMAVSLRAGLFAWFKKVVFSIISWLMCSPGNSKDYQNMTRTEAVQKMEILEYFEPDGWNKACRLLGYDPDGPKAGLVALLKLFLFHLWQPVSYVAIFFVYAPVLANTDGFLCFAAWCVLFREVLYAVSALVTLCKSPGFLLYSMKHASLLTNIAYVLSPEKFMATILAEGCFYCLVFCWSFLADVLSALGLWVGLAAHVLEPPIIAVWTVTAASCFITSSVILILECCGALSTPKSSRHRAVQSSENLVLRIWGKSCTGLI